MAPTVKDLDDRIDALVAKLDATSLSTETFKAKAETAFTFAKWGITLIGGAALAGLLQLYAVANQAGQLQNSVSEIRDTIRKQDGVVEQLRGAVQTQLVVTTELKAVVQNQQAATGELKAVVQKQQAVLTELKMVVQKQEAVLTELKTEVQGVNEAVRRQDAAITNQTQLLQAIAKDIAEIKAKSKP